MSHQQAFVAQPRANGHVAHNSRSSTDLRARNIAPTNGHATAMNGNTPGAPGPVGVPVPRNGVPNGASAATRGGFEGPRSPPNAKNTAHVPCKFWRQGACQAGQSCPFLHADVITPCKYFQKGNCKFGMRCANEHITPDGRRINKAGHLQMAAQLNLGGRVMPNQLPPQTNSLLSMQQEQFQQPNMFHGQMMDYPTGLPPSMPYDIPTIDTTASSLPGSAIGSPQNDGYMGKSPSNGQGLTIHDVPIPGSWDPEASRRGNVSSSVPARFGFDSSPPSSLPNGHQPEVIVRNLKSSNLGLAANLSSLGFSPPANDDFSQRPLPRNAFMHSDRSVRRIPGVSQSYGPKFFSNRIDADDGELFAMDAMYDDSALSAIPQELGDLLTPNERRRRLSRNAEDENNHRAALSGLGTPLGESPKIGSPHALGASPSRFGPLFQRQAREKAEATLGESLPNTFGHVGSPLRPSLLGLGSSPSLRASSRPTSTDFSVSSPPRQTSTSMLAQQLQRQRISSLTSDSDANPANSTLQHPGIQRVASGSGPGAPPNRLDRSISGASSTGFGREKIDEEPEEGLFNMDDEEDKKWKRLSSSNPWSMNRRPSESKLGVIGGTRSSTTTNRNGGI